MFVKTVNFGPHRGKKMTRSERVKCYFGPFYFNNYLIAFDFSTSLVKIKNSCSFCW